MTSNDALLCRYVTTMHVDERGGRVLTHGDERLTVAAAREGGQEGVLPDLAGLEAAVGGAAVGFLRTRQSRSEQLTQQRTLQSMALSLTGRRSAANTATRRSPAR